MARGGTNKRDALLAASLAAGATHEEAAAAAGVSLRTVARRLNDPAFRALVDREQDAILERFVGCTAGRLGATLGRLAELVASKNEQVALGACRATVEALLRLREHASLSRRMGELERANNERDDPPESDGEGDGGPPDEPPLPGSDSEGSGGDSDAGEGEPG